MDLNTAIDVIESVAGFADADTSVGEAWAVVMAQLNAAPAPAGEVAELVAWLRDHAYVLNPSAERKARHICDLLERQAAPVPVASDTRYEFSVFDEDYTEQAGGSAPTYAQALSEGQHYLAQYQQDGPHTLELRRVEVLPPGAFPAPDDAPLQVLPEDAQVIEPTEHTILVPACTPAPVAERLPGLGDCDEEHYCWRWNTIGGLWARQPLARKWYEFETHWLPAHALPLPGVEVE